MTLVLDICACAPGNEKSSSPVYQNSATNAASNRDSTLSFQCIGLPNEDRKDEKRTSSLGKLTTWQTVDIEKRLTEMEKRISDLEDQVETTKSDKSKRS